MTERMAAIIDRIITKVLIIINSYKLIRSYYTNSSIESVCFFGHINIDHSLIYIILSQDPLNNKVLV